MEVKIQASFPALSWPVTHRVTPGRKLTFPDAVFLFSYLSEEELI